MAFHQNDNKKSSSISEEQKARDEARRQRDEARRQREIIRDEEDRSERKSNSREQSSRISLFSNNDPINLGGGGNELRAFVETSKKTLENAKSQLEDGGKFKWDIIPLPASESNYICDAAILVQLVESTKYVNALTIIFSPTSPLPKQTARFDNRTEKFSAIPSDQWTKGFREKVKTLVNLSMKRYQPMDGDLLGMVSVPSNYQILTASHEPNLVEINRLLEALVNQMNYLTLDQLPNSPKFSLTKEIVERFDINALVTYHAGSEVDVFRNPIRSDITVDIRAEEYRGGRRRRDEDDIENSLEGNSDYNLGHITAYPDLNYVTPSSDRPNQFRRRRDEDSESQIYDLNLHITSVDANRRSTRENQLLVLSGIPMLIDENVLVKGLQPRGELSELRNPAVLTNDQDPDFTEIPSNPTDEEWLDICDAIIRPKSTQVYLHIDESAVNAPIQRSILKACEGGKDRNKYIKEIDEAVYNLTDGVVGENELPEEIGIIEPNVVLLGYFTDNQGIVRDLREVQDYITIANFYGASDDYTRSMEKWESACFEDSIPLEWRLAVKEDMIKEMTNGRAVITGHATVVNLNPDWLFALSDGVADTGIEFNAEGLIENYRGKRGGNYTSRYSAGTYSGGLYRSRSRRGRGYRD